MKQSIKKKLAIFIAMVMLLGSMPYLADVVTAAPPGDAPLLSEAVQPINAQTATPAGFTVTFVDRGEVIATRTVTGPSYLLAQADVPAPTRYRYRLTWFTQDWVWLNPSQPITQDMRVYASWFYGFSAMIWAGRWEDNSMGLLVNADGWDFHGTGDSISWHDRWRVRDFIEAMLYAQSVADIVRPGHRFIGWGNSLGLGMDDYITGEIEIWALWEQYRVIPQLPTPQNFRWEYRQGNMYFLWDAVPNSVGYDVQIAPQGSSSQFVTVTNPYINLTAHPHMLTYGRNFIWVRALGDANVALSSGWYGNSFSYPFGYRYIRLYLHSGTYSGDQALLEQRIMHGGLATLLTAEPERYRHIFNGWHTNPYYWSLVSLPDFFNLPITSDWTFHAQWLYGFRLYTDANGGIFNHRHEWGSPFELVWYHGFWYPYETLRNFLTWRYYYSNFYYEPTRPNYRFIGWDTGTLALDDYITGPITITARWERIQQPAPPPQTPPTPQPSPSPEPDAPAAPTPPAAPVAPVQDIEPPVTINIGHVSIEVTVEAGEIALNVTEAQITQIIANNQPIQLRFTEDTFDDAVRVTLPSTLVAAAADAGLALDVAFAQGGFALDAASVQSTALAAGDDAISLNLERLVVANLPPAMRDTLCEDADVFHVSVSAGEYFIRHFDGTVAVTLPFGGPFPAGVDRIDETGGRTPQPSTYNAAAQTVTFFTNHLSLFVVGHMAVQPMAIWENPFIDVSEHAPYFSAVRFVNQQALFMGTTAQHFSPHQTMTRAMMTTVLWRMAGEPSADVLTYVFNDVSPARFYTVPIAWAASQGIVLGTGQGYFDPYGEVTIRQAITIINRFAARFGYTPLLPSENRNPATRAEIAMIFYELGRQ